MKRWYNRWRLIGPAPKRPGRNDRYWRCRCKCGNEGEVSTYELQSGNSNSCGCLQRESIKSKHGMCGTRTYRIWANMIQRCTNSKAEGYENYGGRGITFHLPWQDFSVFFEDMGECPTNLMLERKDNNGHYCPDNCDWVTRKKQNRNKRTSNKITFQGRTLTTIEWEEETGINAAAIAKRIRRGWTAEEALTTPSQRPTQ